jgi:hypothetical protein
VSAAEEGEERSLEISEAKESGEILEEQRAFLLAHAEYLEGVIRRRDAEIVELTARLREVEANLAAVLATRTWRWAARVRAAGGALRRLLGTGRRR